MTHTMAYAASRDHAQPSAYVAGELIVNFNEEAVTAIKRAIGSGAFPVTGIASVDQLLARHGATHAEPVFGTDGPSAPTLDGYYTLTVRPDADVAAAAADFAADPHVRSAQPNYLATTSAAAGGAL